MKKCLLPLCLFVFMSGFAREIPYVYSFFSNSRMPGNYFFSYARYDSLSWIKNIRGKLPVSQTHFHTPGNALELHYKNGTSGSWRAGILKNQIRGQDHFLPATRLSMWIFIRSAGTKQEQLPGIRIHGGDKKISTVLNIAEYLNGSRGTWQRLTIPLSDFTGFGYTDVEQIDRIELLQNAWDDAEHQILIDDVELLPASLDQRVKAAPSITRQTGYERHIDLEWAAIKDPAVKYVKIYRASKDGKFAPIGIQIPMINRYADFTGSPDETYSYRISFLDHEYRETTASEIVSASTRQMTDEELMTMVQEACFRYYWEGAEPISGLARENIPGRHDMIATGASGFGLMALLAGTDRGFISRAEAVARFRKIVDFLQRAETFHGAFPHFYDGTTGKVEPFFGQRDNGGDLVETSFLVQGLLAAREYFDRGGNDEKYIRDAITRIWHKIEWSWYRRYPDNKFLLWHWSPDKEWVINHNLIGWNETMITYLLAMASPTHAVPLSMYYSGWANQDSTGIAYRSNWGQTPDGSSYTNGKTYYGIPLDVGVSTGGPLFFIHYSYMGPDPKMINDRYTNYFENNRRIALINHRYSTENPKGYAGYSDSAWGLTASDGPFRYSADEPVLHQDHGKIAPTGAIASFPYTPELSMKALRNYYRNFGHFLWGEFGFRDAFSLEENWCSEIYMGLNQAPMTVMIENHRSGLIWKTFMKNKEIRDLLTKLGQYEEERP